MKTIANVTTYNEKLINNLTKIALEEYFKNVHEMFYKNINISFMDYFLMICDKDDQFIIEPEKLLEYGVLTNINTSSKILRTLQQYDLKNKVDYLLSEVGQQDSQVSFHGGNNKKIYTLTPDAFKKCLMRAKNTQIYADYYILLEKVYKYYSHYERGYAKKLNSIHIDKIDSLETKLDNQSKDLNELKEMHKNLLGFASETKQDNKNLITTVTILNTTIGELKISIDNLTKFSASTSLGVYVIKNFCDRDCPVAASSDTKISLSSIQKLKTIIFVATLDQLDQSLKIECVNRKLSDPFAQVRKIIRRAEKLNRSIINDFMEKHGRKPKRIEIEHLLHVVFLPKSIGVVMINESEIRSYLSKIVIRNNILKDDMTSINGSEVEFTWDSRFKAVYIEDVINEDMGREYFKKFIESAQREAFHFYDQQLMNSIINCDTTPDVVHFLQRSNIEFNGRTIETVDSYYKGIFVDDRQSPESLRVRKNKKTTHETIISLMRDIVVKHMDIIS